MKNNSIWLEDIKLNGFPKLEKNIKTDVLIIGGGITGILCAYELRKRNIDVLIVEQDKIGMGVTKNTTAFITAQHEMLYQDIVKNFGIEEAKKYLEINLKALNKYQELSEKYDIDFKKCSSILYTNKNEDILLKEKEILDILGYKTEFIEESPINEIKIKKGLKFENQATIHPLKCIKELSKDLIIYENTKIIKLKNKHAYTKDNVIEFNNVIIATHYPFINRTGMYFTKLRQRMSYMVALKYPNINDTYCNIDDGSYFRGYNDYLIIGGNDRETKCICDSSYLNKIRDLFKYEECLYYWNNHDIQTIDKIPYIGRYDNFHSNWYVATGFNMWGFTWAMASSFLLADMIETKEEIYFLKPRRWFLKKQLFVNLKTTLKNMLKLKKPRCAHLGVALRYNKIDKTWECPSHGSRFDSNGNVINDPAKKNIKL